MTSSQNNFILVLLFLFTAVFYIYTAAPALQPYRDVGELAVASGSLSVAHPPGYPAYTILGKFFNEAVLFGNTAYRTKIMSIIFTALFAALAFQIMMRFKIHPVAAFFLTLSFVFSKVAWLLSIVCESYTPDLFFTAVLFYIAFFMKEYPRKLYLFAFIAGISLGIRPTATLAAPAFAIIFWKLHGFRVKDYLAAGLFFLTGLAVYLYLPVRSAGNPPIDWADPETFRQFIYSVTRKAYGHGLDKISEFYALKDTFFKQFFVFSKSLFVQFTPVLFIFGLIGLYRGLARNLLMRALFVFFLITGPLFLFISNMPANPHALVIVEASYLIPFFCFFIFIAYGFKKASVWISAPAAAFSAAFLLYLNFPEMNNRENFFARDWAENVFNSTPLNSTVLLRKDVQLFSVWYENMINGKRKDSLFLAQGMMRADWYRRQIEKSGRVLFPPPADDSDSFFKNFFALNKNVFFTRHFEAGSGFFKGLPTSVYGVLRGLGDVSVLPEPIMFFSAVPNSIFYKDFYRKELCGDYSGAFDMKGIEYYGRGLLGEARKFFLKAIAFDPYNSDALYNLAAVYYEEGQFDEALRFYGTAIIACGREYRDKRTASFIDRNIAKNYNNMGAIYEKKGDFDRAMDFYGKAVYSDERFAQGYYNMGVVHWRRRDWGKVVSSFEKCLDLDPSNSQAKHYLDILKQGRRGKSEEKPPSKSPRF